MAYHQGCPEGADLFTVHRRALKTGKFVRVVPEWWSCDLSPRDVAETFGPGVYRAHYRDHTKARNRGNGEPFEVFDPDAQVVEKTNETSAERSEQAPPPRRRDQAPPKPTEYPAPPLPPGASPELAAHVFLHSMVRQDAMLLQQQMMGFSQMVIAQAHAARDSAVQSARDHYAAMQASADRVHAIVMELQKGTAAVPPELVAAMGQQTAALARIGEQIDDIDAGNDQQEQMAHLLEQLQGPLDADKPNALVGALQNLLPLGAKLWEQHQKAQASAPTVVDTAIEDVAAE